MGLNAGQRLGPYEIVGPIGAGGMGEVYRARDTRLDRSVAIKILSADAAGREDRRARFEREARVVSSLNHPHICALYDIGSESGMDYLVMELLEGETLAQRLEHGMPTGRAAIRLRHGNDGPHPPEVDRRRCNNAGNSGPRNRAVRPK